MRRDPYCVRHDPHCVQRDPHCVRHDPASGAPAGGIAVIVPLYNESARVLARNIEPLPAYSPGFEQLILVDASDDRGARDAARALGEGGGITTMDAPQRGRAAQMNHGAAHARASWLLFLHADCLLPDNAVALVRAAVARGARWGRFDVRIANDARIYRWIESLVNLRSACTGVVTGDQALFVERELFTSLAGFRDMPLMEDVELSRRLKRVARPVRIREPLQTSARRWERHGVARTILLMWALRFLYWCGVSPRWLARWYGYGG